MKPIKINKRIFFYGRCSNFGHLIFFISVIISFSPLQQCLNTSDTIKYQYPTPPPANPMRSSMHPLTISSVPLICLVCRPDSLSFNPRHICNLFWKITHTFCPIFSVPLFHIRLHEDIWFQSQRMRKHWQFWQLEFNYFHLSLFQCAILTIEWLGARGT